MSPGPEVNNVSILPGLPPAHRKELAVPLRGYTAPLSPDGRAVGARLDGEPVSVGEVPE